VTIVDGQTNRRLETLPIALEPAFLALGPLHVGVGINNHVLYYRLHDLSLLLEQEYLGKVRNPRGQIRHTR
jgi:hypothetical protein